MGCGSPRSGGLRLETTGLIRRPGVLALHPRLSPGGARPVQRSGSLRGGGRGVRPWGRPPVLSHSCPLSRVPQNRPSRPLAWRGTCRNHAESSIPAQRGGTVHRGGGRGRLAWLREAWRGRTGQTCSQGRGRPWMEPRPGCIMGGTAGAGAEWAAAPRLSWVPGGQRWPVPPCRPPGSEPSRGHALELRPWPPQSCVGEVGLASRLQVFTEHLLCARPRPAVRDTKRDKTWPRPCTRSRPCACTAHDRPVSQGAAPGAASALGPGPAGPSGAGAGGPSGGGNRFRASLAVSGPVAPAARHSAPVLCACEQTPCRARLPRAQRAACRCPLPLGAEDWPRG